MDIELQYGVSRHLCNIPGDANIRASAALNLSVFLLIGKTSALTMNIAGVVKDWLLIFLSWIIFGYVKEGTGLGSKLVEYNVVLVADQTELGIYRVG